MLLEPGRVGSYVRALHSAVNTLAPDETWVPMRRALNHLHAIDPAVSGNLLAPAELSASTGMPAYTWMARAVAEQELARSLDAAGHKSDGELERVSRLDQDLGERMRIRRSLHQHLRGKTLLASTYMDGAVRRLEPQTDTHIRYDRTSPDGRWLRIQFDLRTPKGRAPLGTAFAGEGRVQVKDSLQHLLTRHFSTPLTALMASLADVTNAQVLTLTRAYLGPFWFPGMTLPVSAPPQLGQGLLLHATREILATELDGAHHLDAFEPAPEERIPDGYGVFRERRFSCSQPLLVPVRDWCERAGFRGTVLAMGVPKARRL